MLFVNEIAQIVHGITDLYLGAANKNIGDAFLLVWKFQDKDIIRNGSSVSLDTKSIYVTEVADLALISFVKINIKCNRDGKCTKYKNHAKLQERMPNYSVKMGFGLHVGWAIEGAIGSEFKIDASYLSPNVNMAARLEAATKMYGVPILVSGDHYKILSSQVKSYCRHIDTVTVKGSNQPMSLYTTDFEVNTLTPKQNSDAKFNSKA
jgi:class 3 adenylate cyclase